MKNQLWNSNLRRIKSSYKRFLSLLFMALLGVGFYAGIKTTSPDMKHTLNEYLRKNNVYDIEIVSQVGLTEEDRIALENLKIGNTTGIKSTDEMIFLNNLEKTLKVIGVTESNQIQLLDGQLPSHPSEIVVEEKLLQENQLKIGDLIPLNSQNLKSAEYKIVGTITSPLYFSDYRGTTNIGNGELNYYAYVTQDAFVNDYYSSIAIQLDETEHLMTGSKAYKEEISKTTEKIHEVQKIREDERYQEYLEQARLLGIEMTNIPKPTWYILDRTNMQAYNTYIDATGSIAQIGTVFPLVFFVVAVLISLISMTRMVDEDRTEIGTLKGLGFSNIQIISKYVFYSFCATTLGGLVGMILGCQLLPRVIWNIYTFLFTIPDFIVQLDFYYGMTGLGIALLCICGATIITALQTLKEKPSNLMRPKAPKLGKKIFLERIPIVWNRFQFSSKITIRNLFRYKKRVLVTIIGIAGSTALVLVGFGLKDSISNVVNYNYNRIFVYDKMISLKNNQDLTILNEKLKENTSILASIKANYEHTLLYNEKKESLDVNLIVPEEKEKLKKVIHLNTIPNEKEIALEENKVVLSEKLACTLKIKVQDKVFFLKDNQYVGVEVGAIVENYVNDYVYMTKNTYENLFGTFANSVIFMKVDSSYDNSFDKELLVIPCVANIVSTSSVSGILETILDSLDSVVLILIIASATLAFVILYNLSNINISERKREISTLKVLGFYDEEVDAYVTKENYIITVIGIAIGLVAGLYLSHYIISTCEPQFVMFIRHIEVTSYVIAAMISFLFTVIVSKITHFNLKKIDMVESLKNNE